VSTDANREKASRRARDVLASAPTSRLAEAAALVAVLGALVVYVAPTLGAPLLEKHAFRQTQTAWTARVFHEDGIDLLHPKLPILGAPFEVPFEFPLYQAVAALAMDLGVPEDKALRATCLLFFALTAVLLWGLVRYVAGPVSGIAAAAAFTFTPMSLVWSRTSMIEYTATAGAVGFAFALVVWRDRRHPLFLALGMAAGLMGMLVKPTTAVFWILPALAYRPRRQADHHRRRWRLDPWLVVGVAVPLLAAVLWTRHADAIKAASPFTEPLTGWNLRRWNFGWTRQRIDPDLWWVILKRVGPNLLGLFGILLIPAAVAAWRSPQRRFWLAVAGAGVLPVLVFMNLYFVHDYYLIGVSPAIAALVGLGAGWIWSVGRRRSLAVALPLAALFLVWGTLELGRGYWLRIHGGEEDPQVLPLASEIRAHTGAGDLVAIVGLDWSPAVLYYAHRRGHMVTAWSQDVAFDLIHRDGYRYLLMADAAHDDLAFMGRWRWVSALGRHLYGLADTAAALPRADVVSTDPAPGLSARLGRASSLPASPESIRCGVATPVRTGADGTWILLDDPAPGARVFVGARAPVPARGAVFVSPRLAAGGIVMVGCSGAERLAVRRVIAAPERR
jgi:hypothetical protein